MDFYALFSVLAAVIYLEMGIYVLLLDKRSPVNIVFALSSLLLFIYSVCYIFFFSASTRDDALLFLRLGSVGWIMIVVTSLHFVMLLTRFKLARKTGFIVLLYLPFIVLLFFSLTKFYYAADLVNVNNEWFPIINSSSLWYQAYIAVLSVSYFTAIFMLVNWIRKNRLSRERKQGRIVLIAILVSMPLIVANNFVLYNLKIFTVPDIAHILSLVNTLGALIAITRYRMLKPVRTLISEEVLSSIEDFIILFDAQARVMEVNKRTEDVLGYRKEELSGKPAGLIVLEENLILDEMDNCLAKRTSRQKELQLISRDGEKLPIQAVFSCVNDNEGELTGLVVIGHNRAGEIALEEETQKRITAEAGEKKQSDNLLFLSRTAMNFIELHDEDNIYQMIGQKVKSLSYDTLNIVTSYNDYQKQFQIESVNGNQTFVSAVHDILGGSLEKILMKFSPEAAAILASGKLLRYSGKLYDMLSGTLPSKKCDQIEKDLDLRDIYLMGFNRNGKLLGGLVLFMHSGREMVNRLVLEAFVSQASIAIQRKKAEELLTVNDKLYRRLIETAFDAIVIHREGKILNVNEGAAKMMGFTNTKEAAGRSLMEFVHPDSREAVKERMRNMYEHGVAVPLLEEKFITKDGKTVNVEVTATGFMYLDTPAVMVVFRDIGKRKKMEEDMRDLQRQIEFVLGATKTGLDIIDSEYRIVFIDPEWKKFYGEPAGRKCFEYFLDRKQLCENCNLTRAMESKRTLVHEEELAKESRWVQVTTIPYQGPNNEWFYAEINVDITERKKIENELMLALREIENLNQKLQQDYSREMKKSREKDYIIINQSRLSAMSEMLQNISHHWKGPLNNIGLLIQNILSSYERGELDRAKMDEYNRKGIELLYGMTHTLDDFGNFLKSDRVKQSFSLNEAVEKAVSLAQVGFRDADIRIVAEFNEDVYVRGLLNETTQIIVNLLNNSREAVVEKNVANAFVKIGIRKEGEHAVLTVTDNGRGIPEEILPHVFEPYFTTKPGKAGIGLYLSREFLEKDMQGRIELKNTGDGLQVQITFPK